MIDQEEVYKSLKGRLTKALSSALSVDGPKKLEVNKIWADDKLDPRDLQSQMDAKMAGRTWGVPVYGDISLVDPNGKTVDRTKRIRLMTLPRITPRNSFIVDGEEFQVSNQLRLKPGVYVKSRPTLTTAHFKFPIGFSKNNFSINYLPTDKKWTVAIGGKTAPLYSFLNSIGMSDDRISDAIGDRSFDQIREQSNLKKDVAKIRTAITGERGPAELLGENREAIQEKLSTLPMVPDVLKKKYGKSYKGFSVDLVEDALKNIQGVLTGDQEPDIDNSRFKEFRTFDDILSERVEKSSRAIQGRIKLRMRDKGKVRDIVQPDKVDAIVSSFFNRSSLSNYPSQSNPMNFISGMTKTTVFGEGSIGNKRAVAKEDRDIDPSMLGFVDPLHTPDAGDIGAVMHTTAAAKKGKGVILSRFFDPKKGKQVDVAHPDLYEKVVAFPAQYRREGKALVPGSKKVRALHRGRVIEASPKDVDLVVVEPADMFDFSSNMVPMVNAMHGGRGLMASKMYDQAVSLQDPEAPLVQSGVTMEKRSDRTFERLAGHLTSIVSPVDGEVESVTNKVVTIRDKKGKPHKIGLYSNFPLNARSFITSMPVVQEGDKVKAMDVLADSNFTKNGTLAIGKNLRTAWLPYRGWNFEDAIVISESAAKKLTSSHMYKLEHKSSKDGLAGKEPFSAYFPNKFTGSQMDKLDDEGIIKIGQVLTTGDPVTAYLGKKTATAEDVILGRISRNLVRPYTDSSQVWEEPFDGIVTDVKKLPDGSVKVMVRTAEPLQVGDKIVSRYAAKGLVSKVVSDSEMPHDKDGNPMEVLMNPVGLPTRMNPAQIYEALLGKVAEKDGKPFVTYNFEPGDLREMVQKELKKRGLSDTEELIDPSTGKSLGAITTGSQFIMKLEHAAKEKFSAREPSGAYTADLRPAKSGEGAQTIGHMETSSLLSHGSLENLRDMASYKTTHNPEFWRAIQMNEPTPPPTQPFAFDKFVSMLKGGGINVERKGTQFQLKPLTDFETQGMSAGEINSSKMLLGKNLKPEQGGLFDETITGGLTGKKWSHIELPYEVPNPVFEPAMRGVLGLSQKQFDGIMSEKASVDEFGKEVSEKEGGLTGPKAIRRMLEAININKAIRTLKDKAKSARGSDLNSMNRAVRFLTNIKKNKIPMSDLFLKKVPVLPPVYRPVYPLPDGTLNVSDVNYLYRDLVAIKNHVRDLSTELPQEHLREQRADLYQAVKAVVGVGDPISSQHYRGVLNIVTGENPKGSYYQSRVLRKQQELSGRAPIVGNPTLGMDEVGIPEDMGWVIFKPFIVQKLVSRGIVPLEAESHVSKRSPIARDAMMQAMVERPVIINRAPTLHKHGILALKPKPMPGKSIHLNQLVTAGFGADFDGDTVAVHVPVTPQAVEESFGMLPSAVPLSTSEKILVTPRHEAQVGLYRLTMSGKKTNKTYDSQKEAMAAFGDGDIVETDVVKIGGVPTTVGRMMVNRALPKNLQSPDLVLDAKATRKILERVARENPKGLAPVVDALKDAGNEYAYLSGLTATMDDLALPPSIVDDTLKKYDADIAKAAASAKSEKDLDRKVVEIYSKASEELLRKTRDTIAAKDTNLHQMIASGGRGNIGSAAQMLASPALSEGLRKVLPFPIRTGYARGMTPADYWIANYGSRRGAVETKLSTAEPGALTKSMVQTSMENRIVPGPTPDDERGIDFAVDDREAVGRYIMADVPKVAKRGDLFDSSMQSKMKSKGIRKVELGSPLMSTHPHGTYALSYGLDERGRPPKPGAFIGITASQALGEPMTQLILGSKHVQGLTGKSEGDMTGFEKVESLLKLPQEVRNKALVAKEASKIEKVSKIPGGWDIRMGGQNHFTPFEPTVRKNSKVNPGDILSKGFVDPRDLLDTKGLDHTRRYMVDAIYDVYNGGVRKKHIETVVRSVTDTGLVTDSGGRGNLVEGDVMPINAIRVENRRNATKLPVELASNSMLMEEVKELGGIEKILTDEDVDKLKLTGRSTVLATPSPVQFTPILKGVEMTPMIRKDWMAAMSYRRLKDVVSKAVAEGWKSDVSGWNPIPGIAYGATLSEQAAPKVGV